MQNLCSHTWELIGLCRKLEALGESNFQVYVSFWNILSSPQHYSFFLSYIHPSLCRFSLQFLLPSLLPRMFPGHPENKEVKFTAHPQSPLRNQTKPKQPSSWMMCMDALLQFSPLHFEQIEMKWVLSNK